jgi:hypothetical protein
MKNAVSVVLVVVAASAFPLAARSALAAGPEPAAAPTPAPESRISVHPSTAKKEAPAVAMTAPAPTVASSAPAEPPIVVYRIETARQGFLYAADHPMQAGELVSFHEYPNGTLVSLRRSEIARVVAEKRARSSAGPRPGEAIDIGLAGPGSASGTGVAGATSGPHGGVARGPGSRSDGTALFNPDRAYRPADDSKLVPGATMGYPNSPNDYREGRTMSYPAAPAVQTAPGNPPTMPESKPN